MKDEQRKINKMPYIHGGIGAKAGRFLVIIVLCVIALTLFLFILPMNSRPSNLHPQKKVDLTDKVATIPLKNHQSTDQGIQISAKKSDPIIIDEGPKVISENEIVEFFKDDKTQRVLYIEQEFDEYHYFEIFYDENKYRRFYCEFDLKDHPDWISIDYIGDKHYEMTRFVFKNLDPNIKFYLILLRKNVPGDRLINPLKG